MGVFFSLIPVTIPYKSNITKSSYHETKLNNNNNSFENLKIHEYLNTAPTGCCVPNESVATTRKFKKGKHDQERLL